MTGQAAAGAGTGHRRGGRASWLLGPASCCWRRHAAAAHPPVPAAHRTRVARRAVEGRRRPSRSSPTPSACARTACRTTPTPTQTQTPPSTPGSRWPRQASTRTRPSFSSKVPLSPQQAGDQPPSQLDMIGYGPETRIVSDRIVFSHTGGGPAERDEKHVEGLSEVDGGCIGRDRPVVCLGIPVAEALLPAVSVSRTACPWDWRRGNRGTRTGKETCACRCTCSTPGAHRPCPRCPDRAAALTARHYHYGSI